MVGGGGGGGGEGEEKTFGVSLKGNSQNPS